MKLFLVVFRLAILLPNSMSKLVLLSPKVAANVLFRDNLIIRLILVHMWNEKSRVKYPGGGDYPPETVGGGVLPKTLTIFMTKIWNFPYPIYAQAKKCYTFFMTVTD